MSRPEIVVDEHIPFVSDIFSDLGTVIAVPGHEIGPETVRNADILVVRSITSVDAGLLNGSSVRFVGTATAGIDHIDTEFLSASDIAWAHAPGANASSVVEYVLAAITVIASREDVWWPEKTLGVIGCGQVGERLCRRAEALGMRVLRNDPPRAEQEGASAFVDLDELLAQSDIISVHVPKEESGPYPTLGLVGADQLARVKEGSWLIQSSRGGTVDEKAAVAARREGLLGALVLDVFENEPMPDLEAVNTADLATGHIAGYSRDAKRNGVLMIRDALLRHWNRTESTGASHPDTLGSVTIPDTARRSPHMLDGLIQQVMDIRADDARFRLAMRSVDKATAFHSYRASYPDRFSWSRYTAEASGESLRLCSALGFATRADYR